MSATGSSPTRHIPAAPRVTSALARLLSTATGTYSVAPADALAAAAVTAAARLRASTMPSTAHASGAFPALTARRVLDDDAARGERRPDTIRILPAALSPSALALREQVALLSAEISRAFAIPIDQREDAEHIVHLIEEVAERPA